MPGTSDQRRGRQQHSNNRNKNCENLFRCVYLYLSYQEPLYNYYFLESSVTNFPKPRGYIKIVADRRGARKLNPKHLSTEKNRLADPSLLARAMVSGLEELVGMSLPPAQGIFATDISQNENQGRLGGCVGGEWVGNKELQLYSSSELEDLMAW